MYLDSEIEVTVRNNIKLLVHCIWDNSSRQAKQDIGLKYAVFQ